MSGTNYLGNGASFFTSVSATTGSFLNLQETVNLAGLQAQLAANSAEQAATNLILVNNATANVIAAASLATAQVSTLTANASVFANSASYYAGQASNSAMAANAALSTATYQAGLAITAAASAGSYATSASNYAANATVAMMNAQAAANSASYITGNAAYSLKTTGGVMTGLFESGGSGLYTLGNAIVSPNYLNSQGAIHTYHVDPKNNFCPLVIEYYPNGDRRNTNQYAALSALQVNTIFQDNTAVSPPGLNYESQVNVFKMITNTSAQIAANPSTNFGVNGTGFTNLTANYTSARPSQFNNANSIAADLAATTYWSAQTPNVFGHKAPIVPPTLENFYSTTDQADFCFLPASIMGTLVVAENDMQVNGLDDNSSRGGISIIVDQKQRTGANDGNYPTTYYGGPPASVSQAFYVNGIAGAFVGTAYATGDNCLRGLDTRQAVDSFSAVISNAYTHASALAMTGTPAPSAAPSVGSSYTVIHIDSISPITATTSYPYYQGGSQGSGIGGFTQADVGTGPISVSYPATFYINGNSYQAVAYQLDGPGYESGYLTVNSVMPAGDKAVGQQLSRPMAALWMGDQQRINVEHTGTNYIAYNPAINNGYGGINLGGSTRITSGILEIVNTGNTAGLTIDQYGDLTTSGSITMTGGSITLGTSTDTNFHPLILSPRDGGHGFQWAPFAGQLQVLYQGNAVSYFDNAGDFTTSGMIISNGTIHSTANIQADNVFVVNGTQVVRNRQTGWSTPSGTLSRALLASGANTVVIIETLNALLTDLFAHGLIGN